MGSLRVPLAVAVSACLLLSCSKESPPAAPKPTPAAKVAAKPAAPAPAPVAAAAVPPQFIYNPVGLRDPFEPFLKIEDKRPQGEVVRRPPTPLQGYTLEQLKLVGIVWGENGKAKALIQDPQGKGYVVGSGTLIGDKEGRIVRIQPDRVVIEERFSDLFGEEKKTVANMMLRKPEGEVGP